MKYSISILFAILLGFAVFAQAPDSLWTRTFGGSGFDEGKSVQQSPDGGYIITGFKESVPTGYFDVYLLKTDANGDTLWTRTFGGSDDDAGSSVDTTTDGGYIITGYTDSYGAGFGDVWLIKTDVNGDTLWTKTYGGTSLDWGFSVQPTTDGGYIIGGVTQSFGAGYFDAWLIKTDVDGDSLWTKTFGGSDLDVGTSVRQTLDGGYVITGYTRPSVAGFSDLWIINTDINGDTLWTKTYGGSYDDQGNSIQQTTEGGYIIAGFTESFGSGNGDVWLIKTDSNGDTLWTKVFVGSDYYDDAWRNSAVQTSDGGYIITGHQGYHDVLLIKTDGSGDTLWTKTFGGNGNDWGASVQQTTDGGYIIAGGTFSFGAGYSDAYLIKIAPDVTSINGISQTIINDYHLQQNYPNPFNPTTTISYRLPARSRVELAIYNLLGQQIRTLVNAHQNAGAYQVQWDGRNDAGKQVGSGIYFYQLKAGNDFVETKKMVLMR